MSERFRLSQHDAYCKVMFPAMASDCEVLFDDMSLEQALSLGLAACEETRRIETKFSRYRDDNIVHRINHSRGEDIRVDDETADLLDFAQQLHELSGGRFDISSGVLRKIWTFDGSDKVPDEARIRDCLRFVGWDKLTWRRPFLALQPGMEIDFGGIGKEYAVDKVFDLLTKDCDKALLVNFGGDLRARGPRGDGSAWQVGVEQLVKEQPSLLEISGGAMATSGDSRRYLLRDGIRYSHILDPRTGWPVREAPRSVTAVAPTCVEAGAYASLALMMGAGAEQFLDEQKIQYWSIR